MVTFKKTKASRLNIKVNPQRRSLKAILLLFIEPCTAGPRKAKKYVNPDTTKVSVTVNRSPNRIYNNSIEAQDMWREISQLFQPKEVASRMDLTRFYTDHKFGSIIDLRSMADTTMHGSGVRFVNTKDGLFLAIERKPSGSRNLKCHVFTISDSQMNIMDRQLMHVQS